MVRAALYAGIITLTDNVLIVFALVASDDVSKVVFHLAEVQTAAQEQADGRDGGNRDRRPRDQPAEDRSAESLNERAHRVRPTPRGTAIERDHSVNRRRGEQTQLHNERD